MFTERDLILVDGCELPESSRALRLVLPGWPESPGGYPGRFRVMRVANPWDIFDYSQRHSGGRWGAILIPLMVGLCPTDTAGGDLSFPPGNRRREGTVGHEAVFVFAGGNEKTVNALEERDIRLGDLVNVNINIGCGQCHNCGREQSGIFCREGTTFLGVGSSPEARSWVFEQTGQEDIPGAYTEGFVVIPQEQIFKVPTEKIETLEDIAVFSQADAVACAMTSVWEAGIPSYEKRYRFNNPEILIAGAGRLGTWHAAVILEWLSEAKLFFADINQENLERAAAMFGVDKDHQYLIPEDLDDPYSRKNLEERLRAFDGSFDFDMIFDTAGHGVFTNKLINNLFEEVIGSGGRFITSAHTGFQDLEAGTPNQIIRNQGFRNGLAPQLNIEWAINFLNRNLRMWAKFMTELLGGLDFSTTHDGRQIGLAELVAQGGGPYKAAMEGTTFISWLNSILAKEYLRRLRSSR